MFQAHRSRKPAQGSAASSFRRPTAKQAFQVHVDEDAEQIGRVHYTVGSQVLSIRTPDFDGSNDPLKVITNVSKLESL